MRSYKECATCETACQGCEKMRRERNALRAWIQDFLRRAPHSRCADGVLVDHVLVGELRAALRGEKPPKRGGR